MTSQLADKIIAYRRELHQNPELSNHEFATTARLTRWLQEAGIRLLPLALKTGVVAEIGSGQGPIIALRCAATSTLCRSTKSPTCPSVRKTAA